MSAEATTVQGSIVITDAHVGVWEERRGPDFSETQHLYTQLLDYLRSRGWRFRQDRTVHRVIRHGHHVGRKGDLEARAECGGRHIAFTFWQNVTPAENPNGGQYDFDRVARMPQRIRLRYFVEAAALVAWVGHLRGYRYTPNRQPPVPEGKPLALIVRDASAALSPVDGPLAYFNAHWGAARFLRGADGWPLPKDRSSYGAAPVDRDGRPMDLGALKYHRHYTGRLWRGRVYPNMNGMHFLVAGGLAAFDASSAFHDYAGEPLRRWFPDAHRRERIRCALAEAVAAERFERAAVLRDLLRRASVAQTGKAPERVGAEAGAVAG